MPTRKGGKGDLWILISISYPDALSIQEATGIANALNYDMNANTSEGIKEVEMKTPDSRYADEEVTLIGRFDI